MKLGGKVFSAEGPRYEVGGKVFSAEGARYDSQGQAPNNVRRVAPGRNPKDVKALKERNKRRCYFALSVLPQFIFITRGDAFRFASRLPLDIIFRAFVALLRQPFICLFSDPAHTRCRLARP